MTSTTSAATSGITPSSASAPASKEAEISATTELRVGEASSSSSPPSSLPPPSFGSPSDLFDESDDECLFVRCHAPDQQPSFVFVCLGVGGGPLENDCSCYMVKPADRHWREGAYVVEGGSWLGALSRVCEDPLPGKVSAFHDFDFSHANPSLRAGEIGSYARAFLLSHAHLDHILGLVLGSASLPGKRAVYGLKSTLENLLGIFDGKLWPKLASFKEDAPFIVYHLKPIECQVTLHLDDGVAVVPFSLSHGISSATVPAPPTPNQYFSTNSQSGGPPASYFGKRYSLPLNNTLSTGGSSGGGGAAGRAVPSKALEASAAFLTGSTRGAKPNFTSPFAPDTIVGKEDSTEASATTAPSMTPTTSMPGTFWSPSQRRSEGSSSSSLPLTLTEITSESNQGGPSASAGAEYSEPISPTTSTHRRGPLSVLSSSRRPKTAGTERDSRASPSRASGPGDGQHQQSPQTSSGGGGVGGLGTTSLALSRSLSRSSLTSVNSTASSSGASGVAPSHAAHHHHHHHPSAIQTTTSLGRSAAPISRSGKTGFSRDAAPRRLSLDRHPPTMDSTAFFLTNKRTGMEVLFFGDVEPDCISRSPRNTKVWSHAARKIARGKLNAVFLECSFPAAQPVEFLWGHLSTTFLVDELVVLARMVKAERNAVAKEKRASLDNQVSLRSRSSMEVGGAGGGGGGGVVDASTTQRTTTAATTGIESPGTKDGFSFFPLRSSSEAKRSSTTSSAITAAVAAPPPSSSSTPPPPTTTTTTTTQNTTNQEDLKDVLKGLTVIVVHVKQALFPSYADGEDPDVNVDIDVPRAAEPPPQPQPQPQQVLDSRTMQVRLLQELRERESELRLGVRFVMSAQGMRIEI